MHFSSTPNSSKSADSGVDNPGFRIEHEGNEQSDGMVVKQIISEQFLNTASSTGGPAPNGRRLTSPTNEPPQVDHPDSAVWTKSPFSRKYRTNSVDTSKGSDFDY